MGLDLDGFLWARRRRMPFVVALKGIIADELQNERGWVRRLLALQARWERLNTARADLVLVTSRYCAEVAQRAYERASGAPGRGAGAGRSRGVGRPVCARAPSAAAHREGPIVLCVARMYPRKRIADLLRAAPRVRAAIPVGAVPRRRDGARSGKRCSASTPSSRCTEWWTSWAT